MKYNRVLLKLSGEALMGKDHYGINSKVLQSYVTQIKNTVDWGLELAIVIGGGNIFRGMAGATKGFDRVAGDQMGMLATVINSLAISSAFEQIGQASRLFTSFSVESIGERFDKWKVIESLKRGEVAILSGGTGNPFFTTDTASALRAVEIGADVLLKGTRVDGVYNADPEKYKDAIKFETLSFTEAIEKNLKVMDQTAFTMCKENNMPIYVFDMNIEGNLEKLLKGKSIGTIVN